MVVTLSHRLIDHEADVLGIQEAFLVMVAVQGIPRMYIHLLSMSRHREIISWQRSRKEHCNIVSQFLH